jgi:Tfp pilus assembly protein PilN
MSKIKGMLGRLKSARPKAGRKTADTDAPQGTTTPVHTPDAPFMRSINLLPDEFRPDTRRIRWNPAFVGAAALILLALVAVGLLYMPASNDADEAKAERDDAAAQVQTLQAQVEEEAREKGISALASVASAELSTAVQGGLASRLVWDRVLDNVTRLMPEGTWIQSLQGASESDAEDPIAPGTLRIAGFSRDGKPEVAKFASRVKALRDIEDVLLESWTTTQIDDEEVYEFTISVTVRGPR